jgi:hypothetical protein
MTLDGKPVKRRKPVLTVRLALFYLSLLAQYSPDTTIGYNYPPLDSWTKTDSGYIHNSTGKTAADCPENATVVEAEPQVQAAGSVSDSGTGSGSSSHATASRAVVRFATSYESYSAPGWASGGSEDDGDDEDDDDDDDDDDDEDSEHGAGSEEEAQGSGGD